MRLGVIGGTGVYDIEGLEGVRLRELDTPFGRPSDAFVCGGLGGHELFFLPRHGRGHRMLPSEINHRANIYGFKLLGVDRIVSISAVGSLKEGYRPRDIVLVDQYYDRTRAATEHTFFGRGLVAHVSMAEPTSAALRRWVRAACEAAIARIPQCAVRVHAGGTYVNMQGPAFSTRAESEVYRRLGFDVIGMTSLGEARLAREAEIAYQPMAMVTDYDCWHTEEAAVTVATVVGHLQANAALGKAIVRELVGLLPEALDCPSHRALAGAILTPLRDAAPESVERLRPILLPYLE